MERVSIRETLIVLVAIVLVGLITVLVLSRDGAPPTRWRFEFGAPASAGPLLHRGVVYAASEAGDVVALDAATGDPRWRASVEGAPRGPIRSDDARLYVSTDEGDALALDLASGAVAWRATFEGGLNAPLVVEDLVVIATRRGAVVGLDAGTGDERWRGETGRVLRADPAVIDEATGLVGVGDTGGRLHTFDAASGEAGPEPVSLGGEIAGPALAVDGIILVVPRPDVVALTVDGQEAWRTTTGEPNRVPMIARAGVLYVDASPDLVAIDLASGAVRWRYTSPAVVVTFGVGEHLAVAGMHTGDVHGIDPATGERLWRYRTNESVRGAPVIDDATGLAYFAGLDGNVYAIEVGEVGEVGEPE